MDLNVDLFQQHAPHVATVKPAVKHIVQAAPVIIKQGYSMLSLILSNIATGGILFGLGWYIKGRGMTGVQIDLNNVKTDVEALKAKLSPTVAA